MGTIKFASRRLVAIAPAVTVTVTVAVAMAVAERFADLDTLDLSVIVDADPEVYRLGCADEAALDMLTGAGNATHRGVRVARPRWERVANRLNPCAS